jgi:hypothetical protein
MAIISRKTKRPNSKRMDFFNLCQNDNELHIIVRQALTVNVTPQSDGLSASTHFDHSVFQH